MRVMTAGTESASAAGQMLAASHADYPAFRHLLADPEQRQRFLLPFMTGAARDVARNGTMLVAVDVGEILGVALWLPPGAWPASWRRKLRMLPSLLKAMAIAGRRAPMWARTGKALDVRANGRPCWYLQALGVSPTAQRGGVGTALMRPILERADKEDVECRLHTSDPRNITYYQRFGFTVGEPMAPMFDGGPSYLEMVRR